MKETGSTVAGRRQDNRHGERVQSAYRIVLSQLHFDLRKSTDDLNKLSPHFGALGRLKFNAVLHVDADIGFDGFWIAFQSDGQRFHAAPKVVTRHVSILRIGLILSTRASRNTKARHGPRTGATTGLRRLTGDTRQAGGIVAGNESARAVTWRGRDRWEE